MKKFLSALGWIALLLGMGGVVAYVLLYAFFKSTGFA